MTQLMEAPETASTEAIDVEPKRAAGVRASLAVSVLAVGVAEILLALANVLGHDRAAAAASTSYWLAIVLLYAPTTVAAWRVRWDTAAITFITVLLSVGTYAIRLMETPTRLATVDELQTLRSLNDLNSTHHLFHSNPLVGSYPRFPGSQILVVTLHQLTHLDFSVCGKVIVGCERVMLALALLWLFRSVLKAPIAAFGAVAVYTTNSSFNFFDAQIAYESFALPLAIATLAVVALASRARGRQAVAMTALATACGIGVCLTHHMTSYWLALVLLAWSVGEVIRGGRSDSRLKVVFPAVATTACAAAWMAFMARSQLAHELGPVFNGSFSALRSALRGESAVKHPFTATGTASGTNPIALQLIGYASVGVSLAVLVLGLIRLRRPAVRSPLSIALLLFGVLYPAGLALRVTRASTETSSRTVEFTLVGLALAAGWMLAIPRVRQKHLGRQVNRNWKWLGLAALSVLAVGGIVIGEAPYDRYAGPYLVQADTRSVTRPGIQAAAWAAQNWPPGSKFAASDSTSALLVTAAGRFTPQSGLVGGLPVAYLFDSPSFDEHAAEIVRVDKISYLVVDRRITTTPSPVFTWPQPTAADNAQHSPVLPTAYLDKFDRLPALDLVYDNGLVEIYAFEHGGG